MKLVMLLLLVNYLLLIEPIISAPVKVELSSNKYWIEYEFPDDESITISITARNQGYVALGFGRTMTNTDMIMGRFEKGLPVVVDLWSSGYTTPALDSRNDLFNITGKRTADTTTFTFSRKLNTGDSKDAIITPNQAAFICFAYGVTDEFVQHASDSYGAYQITFSKTNTNIQCHPTCQTCSGDTESECITCSSDKKLIGGKCVTESFDCDSTCKTCSGPTANSCLSCDSKRLFSNGKCVVNDVILPGSYATMESAGLTFYWEFLDDEVIMALVSKNDGWFSIGTNESMKDSDMVLIEINEKGGVDLSDCYSDSWQSPPRDEERGGTNDLILLGYTDFVNNQRIVKFKRKLVTSDKFDRPFSPNSRFELIAARTGDKRVRDHEELFWIYNVNFVQGYQGKATEVEKSLRKIVKAHEVINIMGWGFLADIGIFAARNLRHRSFYVLIHLICFLITDFGSILIGIIMLAKYSVKINEISLEDSLFKSHIALAIILLIMTFFQHVGGIVLKHKYLEGPNGNTQLYIFKIGHMANGYFLYLVGKINILIGIYYRGEPKKYNAFLAIFIVEIVFHLISHFIYAQQSRKIFKKGQVVLNGGSDHEKLMNLIRQQKTASEISKELPNYNWIMFNNKVCQLNDFLHPGGNFIIPKVIGKEVGRYIYGAYGLEGQNMKAYAHTIYSIDLLDKKVVGYLDDFLPSPILGDDPGLQKTWRLKSKKTLSKTTSLFLFENSSNKIKNFLPGVSWIGRHFTVTAKNRDSKVRLYTTILSFTPENEEYRQYLIKTYDALKYNNPLPNLNIGKVAEQSSALPFIIEKYPFPKAFRGFFHVSEHVEYEISGPIGRGMELRSDLGGTVYLFAGGTGILPFLDFFDYLLKKAIFAVSQGFSTNIINLYKENYSNCFEKSLRVVLYGSFSTAEDFTGYEFIKKLYDISSKENLDLFDMLIRMDKGVKIEGIPMTEGYFDDDFVQEHVDVPKVSRVYVCGPPGMNSNVPRYLRRAGVDEAKIYIV